jgi:dTDP-4-amino-4,6-dideoxygalactose transaminase
MPVAETQSGIPFLDLSRSHKALTAEVLADIGELLEAGAFTNGPQVREFEAAFAAYCETQECVGVASGLDALRLGLIALGLEPGNEVLVPAQTFVATFEAVSQAGGVPVPVDISESDYCIDPEATAAAIGPRTQFILPVHLYGRLADMTALRQISRSQGIAIVEDACQAHGATRDGIRAGAGGDAGAFSFYPGKNLGAMGDAGALVTDDPELAAAVRSLREHGQRRKYEHDVVGWTARMDTVQALFLLHKLPLLDEWNEQRRQAADLYGEALAGVGDLVLPATADRGQVWHLYVIRTANPAGLAEHLAREGIGSGRHYPQPPHLSQAYAGLGLSEGSFPVSERVAREGLSLPIFPGIRPEEIERVAESVRSWFVRA